MKKKKKHNKLYFSLIGKGEVVLMPGDIYYFERVKRVTIIHTAWGEYEIWDKLDDIYKKVSGMDFIRCHNSYIVYLPAIRKNRKIRLFSGMVRESVSAGDLQKPRELHLWNGWRRATL